MYVTVSSFKEQEKLNSAEKNNFKINRRKKRTLDFLIFLGTKVVTIVDK